MAYTKGEWEVVQDYGDNCWVGNGEIPICSLEGENIEANAHLIAAAPDLYEALGFVANQIVAWTDFKPELIPYTKLAIKTIDEARAKVEKDEN